MSICQCQGGGYLQSEITQGLQLLRHECGQTGAEHGGGRSANSYTILATVPCYIVISSQRDFPFTPCKGQAY